MGDCHSLERDKLRTQQRLSRRYGNPLPMVDPTEEMGDRMAGLLACVSARSPPFPAFTSGHIGGPLHTYSCGHSCGFAFPFRGPTAFPLRSCPKRATEPSRAPCLEAQRNEFNINIRITHHKWAEGVTIIHEKEYALWEQEAFILHEPAALIQTRGSPASQYLKQQPLHL